MMEEKTKLAETEKEENGSKRIFFVCSDFCLCVDYRFDVVQRVRNSVA